MANRKGESIMSDIDYRLISDEELVDRLEQGEMQINSDLCAEFMRRMNELGVKYKNTPEDEERWKTDIALSAQRIQREG